MNLVEKFLKTADTPNVKVIEVRDIGKIGIRTLSVAEISVWNELKGGKQRTVNLIKATVVDPETHHQVFSDVADADIERLPADISEIIVHHAVRHNGIVRDKQDQEAELKN
ncbi:MAG: hypothetical protein LWW88_12975 [Acinetobacter sp.]|uniref:hypothetical protein n=1 Tax=Acinetobacter sp. TaxID=472 RepID=UPI0025835304|nr:hypothetical protein [Acinetobacter sp.]MCE1272440.1 hypothetical protein [Acinetobacter sp.]